MGVEAKPDFSGWATKVGLKCSDGRIIMPDAFKHQDQAIVPLVWQHNHNEPANVLGHAVLENRGEEGVYAFGFFNDTDSAKNAKTLVQHGDISSLSIYANGLVERSKQVFHGVIRELSLVLSGANPGALIDNITLAHGDGDLVTLEDEAIIYTGLTLVHGEEETPDDTSPDPDDDADDDSVEHSAEEPTVQEVYDAMTPQQKDVVAFMVGAALEDSVEHSADDDSNDDPNNKPDPADLVHGDDDNEKEGRHMTRNVFEQQNGGKEENEHALSHDALAGIVSEAKKFGSLKEAVEDYAFKHGIENIDVLFPDARNVTDTPEFDSRRIEWVADVLAATRKSPFSRIKSIMADLTYDDARARGYIKGNLKKEEFFGVSKRVTTPSTIYKKQQLDRDDIIDITDFDVVTWLKSEMRLMLDEELARAVLIGDGRDVADEDKIKDPAGAPEGAGIRSILNDHDLYVATVTVDDAATSTEVVDGIISAMGFYKGSGSPTFYTTLPTLTKLLLTRDEFGHRLWKSGSDLASEMGISSIVTVEVMEQEPDVIGILVNLKDYTIGADKGGDVNFFDDFDIDYNQYKYLLETRVSGALTRIRSAMVVKRASTGATLVEPTAPTFNEGTGAITIPTQTGTVYRRGDTNAVVTTAVPPAPLTAGQSLTIKAEPASSAFYFESNQDDEWTFSKE